MDKIKGKRILLFYPSGTTAHYGKGIIKELEKRGASVTAYDERPSQSTGMKVAIRLLKKRLPLLFLRYIERIILQHPESYDYVFVIRGEAFTVNAVNRLREAYPAACFILYLWDILQTTNVKECIPYFDKVFSFDPQDAKVFPHMVFRPTFYLDCFKEVACVSPGETGVTFIGTVHSNRFEILKRIRKVLEQNNLSYNFYYFLPSRLVYWRDFFCKRRHPDYRSVHFYPLSLKDTLERMKESCCMLDLKYPSQISLSMRAFEALAAKRKYITNNPEIRKYDFYRSANILVIDEKCPVIPEDFVQTPFEEIPEEICRKYSLEGWIDAVFNSSISES